MSTPLEKRVKALEELVGRMGQKTMVLQVGELKRQIQVCLSGLNTCGDAIELIVEKVEALEKIEAARQGESATELMLQEKAIADKAEQDERDLHDRLKAQAEREGVSFDVLLAAHHDGANTPAENTESDTDGELDETETDSDGTADFVDSDSDGTADFGD